MTQPSTVVVFDLGGVVVDWDPVPAIAVEVGLARARAFLDGDHFDWAAWNHAQDAGRPWAEAEASAVAAHPQLAQEITAYRRNYPLSLRGLVPGTSEIMRALHARGIRLVALTNWSAETFPHATGAWPEVFALFDDIVVSGEEGIAKPDPAIFAVLAARLGADLDGIPYIDDSPANLAAGARAGLDAIRFVDAEDLGRELRVRGLLP